MNPRLIAQVIAAGRLVIGSALVAKPEAITGHWVGSTEAGTRTMAAGLGVRDIAIGAGVLAFAGKGGAAKPWLIASALADLGDLTGALRNRAELPGAAVAGTAAVAGGAALLGAWLSTQDV